MNNDPRNSGPEYVSETEYRVVRAKRRGKVFLLISLIPLVGLLGAGFVVYSTVSARYIVHKRLLDGLTGLKNYSVKIFRVDADGKKSPWREEMYYGDQFEIKLFNGQVIFKKLGNQASYYEPAIHGHRGTLALAPSKPFLIDVGDAVPSFAMFTGRPDDLQESVGPAPHTFTFRAKDLNYRVQMDAQDSGPAEISIEGNTLQGPQKIMQCEITPLSSPEFDALPDSSPEPKHNTLLPLAFTGPGGDHATIVAADMNVRGDSFFLVRTDIPFQVAQITREKLDRYYNPEITDIKINDKPYVLIKYTALDDNKVEWPTTMDATFSAGFGRGQASLSFKYTFKGPTCYLLPLDSGVRVSAETCDEFLFDAARARADYFASSFLQNGVPRYTRGPIPEGYVEIAGDRPKSVRENVAASFYGHQLIMDGEDVSQFVADGWGSAARLLVFLGKGEEAHNAFFAADALRR